MEPRSQDDMSRIESSSQDDISRIESSSQDDISSQGRWLTAMYTSANLAIAGTLIFLIFLTRRNVPKVTFSGYVSIKTDWIALLVADPLGGQHF